MKANCEVEEISETHFSEILANPKVVVDFFAEWCMPCVMMSPIIEEIAEKMKEIKFVKVNIDDNSALVQKFKIMSVPSIVIFKEGKEAERIIGSVPAELIEEKIKKLLK